MGIERTWKTIVFLGVIFVGSVLRVAGQGNDSLVNVSPRKFVHGLRVEGRPEYIFPTSSFLNETRNHRELRNGNKGCGT